MRKKTKATDFRDYPGQLPVDAVRERTKFTKGDLKDLFGLHFPPDGPLECFKDQNWNARDCLALGLNMNDLCDLGLRYVQQYMDLMERSMTASEAAQAEKDLKVTQAQINSLVNLDDVLEQQTTA